MCTGIFPYTTAWVLLLSHFYQQLEDLKEEDAGLYDTVPSWVPLAIIGTFVTFTAFTFPQWWWQWYATLPSALRIGSTHRVPLCVVHRAPPMYYWKTEMVYVALSLTSKVFLGYLLFQNVLRAASFDESLTMD